MSVENDIVVELRSDSDWFVDTFKLHDYCEINLALTDAGMFFLEDRVYQLRRGTMLCISNFLLHRNMSTELGYQRYIIFFSPHIVQKHNTGKTDLLGCFHDSDPMLQLSEEQLELLIIKINRLMEVCRTDMFGNDVLKEAYLIEILVILNRISRQKDRELAPVPMKMTRLSPIVKYINDNIADDLSLNRIASHFYMSKSHLCAVFKESVGLTVNEYILHRRILTAKQLIDSGIPLMDVCERCGFNNYTSFGRSFKKHAGCSPREYKEKTRTEHASRE